MYTSVNKAWLAICVSFLAACTVGPKYLKPTVTVPPAYKELGADGSGDIWKASLPGDQSSRGQWWTCFNDPQLNALEERVSKSNQNVAAAADAVLAAQALVRQARSQYFPAVAGGPTITNSRLSTFGPQPAGVVYTQYSMPLSASWEPDLWGRVRNTVKAGKYASEASRADLENVRLAAQAQLAADYYQLRAQDELKRVLDATVKSFREALELTQDLGESGLGADEAIAQAEAQLKMAEAQDTNIAVLRAQYEHAIAVLVGEPAGSFSIARDSWENSVPAIPVGLPSQLLERRPDIAAAERSVAQANAQIGIAKAAFYPNVTLSASGGLENISIAKWLTWPGRIWSVGPALTETLFDAGLRKATVQQYQATYDQTVANYRQTVLTAFQQVEDNLAALRVLSRTIEQQETAVQAAQRNLREAVVRYTAGLDAYLNVLTAQAMLLGNQQTLVSYREQQMVAAVQLIEALGGGWEGLPPEPARQSR